MSTKAKTHLFFDTVTLSNFAMVERLDLLIKRYGRKAQITHEVLNEVLDGIVAGYSALKDVETAVNRGRLGMAKPLDIAKLEVYRELLRVLGPGEASCIACAKARGDVVVTDDRVARECCAERGIKFTGTIGILKACCSDETLSVGDADDILKAMIDAGYHSPVDRISGIM